MTSSPGIGAAGTGLSGVKGWQALGRMWRSPGMGQFFLAHDTPWPKAYGELEAAGRRLAPRLSAPGRLEGAPVAFSNGPS